MNSFSKTLPEQRPDEAQYAKEIWQTLGCQDPLTKSFIRMAILAIKVFDFKQTRYGTGNIAAGGELGVRLRLSDKSARLMNLMKKGAEPEDETVEDTFGDVGVYGLIGLMARYGLWPGVDGAHPQAEKKEDGSFKVEETEAAA